MTTLHKPIASVLLTDCLPLLALMEQVAVLGRPI